MQTWVGCHVGCVALVIDKPSGCVATVWVARNPPPIKMREWLIDQQFPPKNDLTDTQLQLQYKVFSRLEVGDCAWRDVASYGCKLLHLEQQFTVSYSGRRFENRKF